VLSREAILNRLRKGQTREPSELLPKDVPDFPDFDDPIDAFKSRAEMAGTVVLDGRNDEDLIAAMRRILKEAETSDLYWERGAIFEKHKIPFEPSGQVRGDKGPSVLVSRHGEPGFGLPVRTECLSLEQVNLPEVSISVASAERAIAETGTVVESSAPVGSRVLSVLPPIHIVFFSPKDVLMNHKEFFESVDLGEHESARLLVTGPSRTADIEKTLIIGVHGPKKLFAILR
jgi:hypothetical protein